MKALGLQNSNFGRQKQSTCLVMMCFICPNGKRIKKENLKKKSEGQEIVNKLSVVLKS